MESCTTAKESILKYSKRGGIGHISGDGWQRVGSSLHDGPESPSKEDSTGSDGERGRRDRLLSGRTAGPSAWQPAGHRSRSEGDS